MPEHKLHTQKEECPDIKLSLVNLLSQSARVYVPEKHLRASKWSCEMLLSSGKKLIVLTQIKQREMLHGCS